MRTEGVYTYWCNKCETTFAVVSRFKVKIDQMEMLKCPKCFEDSCITGEGYIKHIEYKNSLIDAELPALDEKKDNELPDLLRADDIAKYLNVSKRVAYEYMERTDFPLIRFGRSKRTTKQDFIEWINLQKKH